MIESRLPLTVFKVGGSLFDLPDLPERLASHFSQHRSVVIFGGGSPVDRLRDQASQGVLDNADAHWQAIDLMSFSAQRQSKRWPEMPVVKSIEELSVQVAGTAVFDVTYELQRDAGKTLPIGWQVTSDSIAAWLAQRISAADLILVKSVGGPKDIFIEDAHSRGWVDDYFRVIAADLVDKNCGLGWINARLNPPERLGLCFSTSSRANDRDG